MNAKRDYHHTAISVVVGENTSDFVLIRSRTTGLWRFPGDRVRAEDVDIRRPSEYGVAAENAVVRIVGERTGLIVRARCIIIMRRPIGPLYGFVGLADLKKFAPRDKENTRIISEKDILTLEMSALHKAMFHQFMRWVGS